MNTYSGHTDEELLALMIDSDAGAFEAIYSRYVSKLYSFAGKTVQRKEDCKEMVQEVFATLWIRRENLGHVRSLAGYLFGSVRHKIIGYIRHQKLERMYAAHYTFFEAVYDTMGEKEIDSEIVSEVINKSISELPKRCQMAIKMRISEGLSNAQIAERMNITKGTVELYMVKALSRLRESRESILKRIEIAANLPLPN